MRNGDWVVILDRDKPVASSELLLIECPRVLDRYRLEKLVDDEALVHLLTAFRAVADGLHIIELTGAVEERAAEPFPTVVGTLDALHLSSAALWAEQEGRETVTVLTADRQMAQCARAMGFVVGAQSGGCSETVGHAASRP